MKRDIKINYGKIEDIISNIIKYDDALNDMEASLNYIKAEINNSTGESIDSLLDNYELLIKNIGICKEELNDLRKILSDYINEMSGYAQAIHRGSLIRVDRNDVWWNIKSMEGIINQITDEQMRWGYNYSGSWSSDKDVIRREEHNGRQIESINHIVEKYVNTLNQKIQEIYAIHNSKVIPFENTDDAFRDRAWNMYWKCTGLGDWVGDFFGFLDKSFNNIIDGVLKGLTDLVVGLAQLAIGAVEYVGSCAVVVLCEPFGGAPDWAKNKVNEDNELILSILKDPALIIEGIAQDASDAVDEKGICYSAGYLGGTFLGTKGLDKITKGVKGLISGTETATIKSLEQGATQALKSIKDIFNKAGNKSIEELNKIVTKVYSRVNGVLDVEVAGYGRIRIKESSLLDDVDKICKDRYVKWAEGKSLEVAAEAEKNISKIKEIEVKFNYRTKYDEGEFARQLADQEAGMNKLTVDEYLKNRERYIAEGRAIEGNAAQKIARENAYLDKVREFRKRGLSAEEAKIETQKWIDTQAALHNPDQIAGGNPLNIGGMGDKKINSSIGSQWKYRIDMLDEEIRALGEKMTELEKRSTYLNVKLRY
ncbi:polymorphic toxin type 15 domain-containing protein [Clostridium sporogenes]|uniref:polymorphic toxin type 15 domain-containing protein n=4 Tax=Clostridium sporogenes TaxID=1509 RepID=UPI003F8FF0FF